METKDFNQNNGTPNILKQKMFPLKRFGIPLSDQNQPSMLNEEKEEITVY